MPPTVALQTKFCSHCCRNLPITDFRFRKRGQPGRQGCCRDCYNHHMRAYRFVRRSKTIHRFSAAVLRTASQAAVARLCTTMVARYGGTDGFSQVWKEHLDAAPRGSRIAPTAFSALIKLMEIADAKQESTDYSGLTDEELDREI